MTTTRDIIKGALRNLAILATGEEPDNEESSDALVKLNDMLYALPLRGVDYQHSALTLNTEFPFDPRFDKGMKALLAVEMMGEHGVEAMPTVVADAAMGMSQLQAAFNIPQNAAIDAGITRRRMGALLT